MISGRRTVLMLVWTSVATDTRVLREAGALVDAGYDVHVIGRAVPADFTPPSGITVGSVGLPPMSAGRSRALTWPERALRWALLPVHVERRLKAWQRETLEQARSWAATLPDTRPALVHAHDFTALPVGSELAGEWDVPLVYDTHEYWVGRPVEGRPAPLLRRRQRDEESRLGGRANAVITVGDGVAAALRKDHPDWPGVAVVRNTFPLRDPAPVVGARPSGLVYAGRLAAYRELEVIAAASRRLSLPVTLVGPSDDSWGAAFDPGTATVLPSEPLAAVDRRLSEAGVALVTHSDRWPNHRLAMPNKLFHAVSLGIPVVATDVGELGAIVREHALGTLYRPGDADSLVLAVEALLEDYQGHVAAVAAARPQLSWEHDAQALVQAVGALQAP